MALDMLRQALVAIPPQVYFFAIGFLFIGWYVAHMLLANRRRERQVREWCEAAGFAYRKGPVAASSLAPMRALTPQPESPVAGSLPDGIISVDAERVAEGVRGGVALRIFDATEVCRSHRSHRGHGTTSWSSRYHTWVLFELPDCDLPRLSFFAASAKGPGSLEGRILAAVAAVGDSLATKATGGLERASLPGHPGLALVSDNPSRARALFEPLCDFFGDKRGWAVEAEGPWVLVGCSPLMVGSDWCRRPLVDYVAVKKYDQFVTSALGIAERIRATASAG
jgi:hypothetical protein